MDDTHYLIYRRRVQRWYNSMRWRRKRQRLLEQYPHCQMCGERGEFTDSCVADHVVPHRGDADLFWKGELQALCAQCHNSDKRRMENQGRIRPRRNSGCDAEGNPLEQQEHWA